jgi:AraC-like DNA-binding protein
MLPFAIIGIFLSILLLYFNARRFHSSIYLSMFFFLLSIYILVEYSVMYSKSVLLVSIFYLNFAFLFYLIGPAFYLYFRSILTDSPRLKKKDLIHLIPMFITLVVTFPYTLTSWAYKVETATKIVSNSDYIGILKPMPLFNFLPVYLIYLSRPLLVLGYALWSVVLVFRYVKGKGNHTILLQKKFMIKWIIILVSALLILILSHIVLIIFTVSERNLYLFYTMNMVQFISFLGLLGLIISPFLFPEILYGLPLLPEKTTSPFEKETDPSIVLSKNSSPELEADYLETISQKVESVMAELKPYLQTDCNLSSFARLVNIPAHHLAYYFREVRKQSFNDFRNQWRVKHAENLIIEGRASDITLEAIGSLSGFSSRNTFFLAFKKSKGISPGTFAAQYMK